MGFQLPTSTGEFTGFQNHQQGREVRPKAVAISDQIKSLNHLISSNNWVGPHENVRGPYHGIYCVQPWDSWG